MQLRPYQQQALDAIREYYAKGTRKVLLHLATGGGKTLIFCEVLKGVQEKGKRAMMVVRGRKLVDQASKRLDREGVDHGVVMAGHWRLRPNLPIQICSIDTLHARRHKAELPEFDLIVIDEAHYATAPTFMWLIERYANSFFLPVTATPHVTKGLRHVADEVVYPITLADLIGQGFLCPPEYYAPSKPNLDAVKVDRKTGDYNLDQLADAMQKANLYGDMVGSYQKLASGLPALLFCVSVAHSKQVCEAFNAAGIASEHLDADMPDHERNRILVRFEAGLIKVLCNVGIFTTGVDIPSVQCIMLARPTKSYNLYIQILGRGTRTHPGKTKFIVLDHADCISHHGFIERERPCILDADEKEGGKARELDQRIVICTECFHVWDPANGTVCEMCGHDMKAEQAKARQIHVDSTYELKKIESIDEYEKEGILGRIRELAILAISKGSAKPAGRVYHQLKLDKKYGPMIANKYYKKIEAIVREVEST